MKSFTHWTRKGLELPKLSTCSRLHKRQQKKQIVRTPKQASKAKHGRPIGYHISRSKTIRLRAAAALTKSVK